MEQIQEGWRIPFLDSLYLTKLPTPDIPSMVIYVNLSQCPMVVPDMGFHPVRPYQGSIPTPVHATDPMVPEYIKQFREFLLDPGAGNILVIHGMNPDLGQKFLQLPWSLCGSYLP